MLSNLPDGCRERDLPGYYNVDCTNCEDWLEEEAQDCPYCGGTGVADSRELEEDDDGPDYDDRDYDDGMAEARYERWIDSHR